MTNSHWVLVDIDEKWVSQCEELPFTYLNEEDMQELTKGQPDKFQKYGDKLYMKIALSEYTYATSKK